MWWVAGLASCPLNAQSPRSGELQLDEIASVSLPKELAVLGGAVSDDGSVLLWSPRGVWLVPQRGAPAVQLCAKLELHPRYAAFSRLPRQFEVYDSGSQRILGVDPGSGCRVNVLWTASSDESMVGRTASSWIEVRPRGPTQLSVRIQNGSTGESTISIPDRQPLRFGGAADYVTAPDGESILLTEVWFPFRTVRVGARSGINVALDPAAGWPLREDALSCRRSARTVYTISTITPTPACTTSQSARPVVSTILLASPAYRVLPVANTRRCALRTAPLCRTPRPRRDGRWRATNLRAHHCSSA
jgi:hypothetical protein